MKAAQNGTGCDQTRPLDLIRPGDGDPRHGTRNGYGNMQCRCVECRQAWADYARDLRKRKREALGAA